MGATGRTGLARRVRRQAAACGELGSPLYAGLLRRIADDLIEGGPSAAVLAGHEQDQGSSALAIRLMGGVHRLVLERRAPVLALHYPSVGGTFDGADSPRGSAIDAAWLALREVLAEHVTELRGWLAVPPQTNEVGRAAALIGGLIHIGAWHSAPVRLVELGASAGLNLRADRFRVECSDGRAAGPAASPVVLRDAWRGPLPGASVPPIIERYGCDPAPVDPTTPEGRLLLTAYVWPDQPARLQRLRGALAIAADVPATVERSGALELLRRVELVPGATTVVWHSVMWQYVEGSEQVAVLRRLDELGATADERTGLAHLSLEPGRSRPSGHTVFLVTLRTWPGGEARVIGTASPHGIPTEWQAG